MKLVEQIEIIRNAVKAIQLDLGKIRPKVRDSINDELWLILRRVSEIEQIVLKEQEKN